jgi:hypothetical protein
MIFPHYATARFTSWEMMAGKNRLEELPILTAVHQATFREKMAS